MKVEWTNQALEDALVMRDFIAAQWTPREVGRFLLLLAEFEKMVVKFPKAFPPSEGYPGCHRARIHENVSVIYELRYGTVRVLAIVDNRSMKPR